MRRSTSRLSFILFVFSTAATLAGAPRAFAQGSPNLVISQVYGGGGNSGAPFQNDYIEIFNRGSAPASLDGKSVQYTSATGTGLFGANSGLITVLPNVTLNPGQYFLVSESGGAAGVALPTADATGSINMSATGGKVALINSTTPLGCNGGSTPCSAAQRALIIDLIGYDGANFFEGSAAPTLSNTTAALRKSAGCTDTDNNGADFTATAPAPRNSASIASSCTAPTSLTLTGSAVPGSVGAGDSTTLNVSVTPGANPTSTGVVVTGDLSSIGGAASQLFTDNGGGIFSFTATVAAGTPTGSRSLPVSATDAQGRSASATIALTVTPPVPRLTIHDIQGRFIFSVWAGHTVETQGIVTARKSNGFFIQAPDAEVDADAMTPEGIFVFTSAAPPAAAAVGSRIAVRGLVQDFVPSSDPLSPPVTEIAGSPSVVALSSGNPLPMPITIGAAQLNPGGSISQLAPYEGMRVHVDALDVVAPTGGFVAESSATSTSNGIFFGVAPGTPRPFREPGIEAPAVAPPGVPQFDANPERLRVDSRGQIGSNPIDVATGATVWNLTGVLDFGARAYTLAVDPGAAPAVTNNDLHATAVRTAAGEGEFTVASFNLERFYDTADDRTTSDVVLTAAALERRLAKASLAIRNVLQTPDVLGVEEMENLAVLQALAARIDSDALAAGQLPPGYVAYLAEGNDIGGIDVGLLVKASRVAVNGVTQVNKDETYVEPDGSVALLNDRPPLVMTATLIPQGKELPFAFTVIVNHLRSLTGIDGSDGARIRAKRLAQAESLAKLIDARQLAGERVIAVGDFNAFDVNDGYVDVINTVRGGPPHPSEDVLGEPLQLVATPLVDLAPADPAQHYSYSFDGSAQVLDHIIVSQTLAVTEFTYARNDADFPDSLRSDATRPERISDHDIPVAYFGVDRDTVPPIVALTGVVEGATYLLGQVPATQCTTSDAFGVATPATLAVTGGDANGVGSITATCSGAVDRVGNIAADVSVHYQVVAYLFTGFAPPLGTGVRTVKGGSTVPVKFQVFDWNGALVTNTTVVTRLEVAVDPRCGSSSGEPIENAGATGDTALRFDGTQFVFNWSTKGLAAGCYTFGVRTADTLSHAAEVVIR